MKDIRRLERLLRGSRAIAWASVAVASLQALVLIPIALLIRHAFDDSIPGKDASEITVIGLAVLGLYLISTGLSLLARSIALRTTKRAMIDLRGDLLTKVYSLPRPWFDKRDTAKVHGTIVFDSEQIDVMANALIGQLLPAAVVASGLLIAMLILNPLLFGLLVLIGPLLLLCSAVVGRATRRRAKRWRDEFQTYDSQTLFALRSITLTKAHGADAGEVAARHEQVETLSRRGYELAFMASAYSLLNQTVMAIGGVIVLILGGRAVANGSMSLGDLISFFTLLALLRGQTPTLLSSVPAVFNGMESLKRIEELLDSEEEEPYQGSRRVKLTGTLAVEGVTFAYDGPAVLKDVSLAVEQGERLVIVGPNGAGKTTLISLVLGLYRPQTGRLTANGIPFDEVDMSVLRSSIGVVMQDPLVFNGTIRENVSFGTPGLDDESIREAAHVATADEFIDRLPLGLDTAAGDDGVLLSGGQRQRLAIARALVRKPALLILDEPTTYMDSASAAGLMENLRNLEQAPAIILVTHDPLISAHADRSIEIHSGSLREGVTG